MSVGDKIIANIAARMSGQAATQNLLNKMLEEVKADTLPEVRGNGDNLTEGQKAASIGFCNFFCKLNILTNVVDITNQTLCKFEESSEDELSLNFLLVASFQWALMRPSGVSLTNTAMS